MARSRLRFVAVSSGDDEADGSAEHEIRVRNVLNTKESKSIGLLISVNI